MSGSDQRRDDAAPRRGRPKAGPRARRNSRRGGKYDIVDLFAKPFKTDATSKAAAQRILEDELRRMRDQGREPVPAPRDVLIGEVIEEVGVSRRYYRRHLLAFWRHVPLRELTRDACWAYGDGYLDADNPLSVASVNNHLAELRRIINIYCTAHVYITPRVHMLEANFDLRPFVRKHEVERLFNCADQGWIWDAGSQDWLVDARGKRVCKGSAWLALVAPMRRMIRLVVWTGSRVDVVRRALWSRPSEGNQPWYDMRIGVLRRRGASEADTSKRRPPVAAMRKLDRLVTNWAMEDVGRSEHIVHRDAAPISEYDAWKAFAEVRRAAGLGDEITMRVLRATCAVWLMEAGCTPEEAAAFLGNTKRILSRFYDRYAPEHSHAAADALDSRSYAPNRAFKAWVEARQSTGVEAVAATNYGAKSIGAARRR